MEIEIKEHDNGIFEVVLNGRLDIAGTSKIETPFAAYANRKNGLLMVDMSGVEFMSSIGIRLLLVNAKSLRLSGGKMVLLSPQPMVLEVLNTSGVVTLLAVYADRNDAIQDLLNTIK
jgi:anti-anti-sigma factor